MFSLQKLEKLCFLLKPTNKNIAKKSCIENNIKILIPYIFWKVHFRHLTFSLETWCLAVNYLDRFLSVQAVDKECLQVGTGMHRYPSRQVDTGMYRYLSWQLMYKKPVLLEIHCYHVRLIVLNLFCLNLSYKPSI